MNANLHVSLHTNTTSMHYKQYENSFDSKVLLVLSQQVQTRVSEQFAHCIKLNNQTVKATEQTLLIWHTYCKQLNKYFANELPLWTISELQRNECHQLPYK